MEFELNNKNINTQMAVEEHTSVIKEIFKVLLRVGETLHHVAVLVIKDLICDFVVWISLNLRGSIDLKNRKGNVDDETLHMRESWDLDGPSSKVLKDVLLIENPNVN